MLAALSSERAAGFIGRVLTQPVQLMYRLTRSQRKIDLRQSVLELRHESVGLLRGGGGSSSRWGCWPTRRCSSCCCGRACTCSVRPLTAPEIFAGYALERVLTLIMITPAGTGFVEAGMTGLLIAVFHGDPITTVAGVLIYRAFTFGLEIPVGAANLGLWLWRRRGAPPGRSTSSPEVALEAAA